MAETCPVWFEAESDDKLPHVVTGLREFYRFIVDACQKHYILNHGDLKTNHRKVFERVVPLDYYAGNYRCDDPKRPCLATDVQVGGVNGLAYQHVPDAMRVFSEQLKSRVIQTDEFVKRTPTPADRARAVCQLAAVAMMDFIKIHPFINGNGRTARMLVNYIFKRYEYEMPFTSSHIRPPEPEYSTASAAAMTSDPKPLYVYLLRLFTRVAPK